MENLLVRIKKELILNGYSHNTKKSYLLYVKDYINFCNKFN